MLESERHPSSDPVPRGCETAQERFETSCGESTELTFLDVVAFGVFCRVGRVDVGVPLEDDSVSQKQGRGRFDSPRQRIEPWEVVVVCNLRRGAS